MHWPALLIAGLFEIGWPLGLKIANSPGHYVKGIALAVICMFLSGALLWYAQKEIPIGTAYAVWTSIGAAGTFIIGILFFNDPASLIRYFGLILIISGVIVLKLTS